jgi:hypothetical protein
VTPTIAIDPIRPVWYEMPEAIHAEVLRRAAAVLCIVNLFHFKMMQIVN